MTEPKKLLVVGPSWVGDMVMAQSLYQTLSALDPRTVIDVLAPAWSLPLLARMPEVRRGIELPVGHGELAIGRRRRLGRSLRGQYDHAIVLPRSLKSALVPWFAKIPQRTGFRGEYRYGLINDMRPFDADRLNQTVLRFVALGMPRDEAIVSAVPEPKLSVDERARQGAIARLGLDRARPIVAMMPGAEYGPAKQWPMEKFSELARRLARLGAAIWILGSEKERALGEAIVRSAESAAIDNLCGQTSLVEAVDLISSARVAVSNDSGLMHIAAAVGTYTVSIYGSSTPDFTPPLTSKASIHYLRLGCSPCFERQCPLGHLDCLNGIDVDSVFASVERELLDGALTH